MSYGVHWPDTCLVSVACAQRTGILPAQCAVVMCDYAAFEYCYARVEHREVFGWEAGLALTRHMGTWHVCCSASWTSPSITDATS